MHFQLLGTWKLTQLKSIPPFLPFVRGVRGDLFTISFPLSLCLLLASPAWSTPQPKKTPSAADLNLSQEAIEDSPVLQRWLRQVPNILEDIANDPSFRTRLRLGYMLPSAGQASGVNIGIENMFIGRSGFTIGGEYQTTFNGQHQAYGADLNYYVRPLGSYVNFAPVVGYRYLETDEYTTNGVNLGARLLLVLSRGGAADISLTQSWVSPGTDEEVGITTLSFGYAITRHLRLSTDLQRQNSREDKDSRFGIVLEWMP